MLRAAAWCGLSLPGRPSPGQYIPTPPGRKSVSIILNGKAKCRFSRINITMGLLKSHIGRQGSPSPLISYT